MANLGYCRLIILRPFKLENEAVGFPGEGLNTQEVGELLSADGVLGLWRFIEVSNIEPWRAHYYWQTGTGTSHNVPNEDEIFPK
jgi:hypothetical protein